MNTESLLNKPRIWNAILKGDVVCRLNTAYIEIYYEQLNFESLKETAGYSVRIFTFFHSRSLTVNTWIAYVLIILWYLIELPEIVWGF